MINGIGLGLLSYALFSTSDATTKGLGPSLSVFEILFFLTLFSFLTFPFAKPAEESWRDAFSIKRPGLVAVRSLSGVLSSVFVVYSFTTLPLAEAYSLIFLMPAFVTILSIPILGEQVGWRRWLAVALGFAGVLLVVRPGFRELHLGHLSAIVGAALSAVSMIALRMAGQSEKRISLLTALYVTGLVVDGALMLFSFRWPGPRELGLAAIGGIFGGAGNTLILAATRLAPANRVAPMQYSQILWAVVFGAVFFGDMPDLLAGVGMVLVAASGFLTFIREETLHGWSRRTFLMRNRP